MSIPLAGEYAGGAELPPDHRAGFSGRSDPFGALYDGLRRVARGLIHRGARSDLSLGPTGLVHEAVVRLLVNENVCGHADRRYVFGSVVRAMQRILIDRARARKRQKRGGNWQRVPYEEAFSYLEAQHIDVLDLHEAVERLGRWSARQAEVVRLRYFARMKVREIAASLGVSVATVEDDLKFARAWLRRELGGQDSGPPA